MRHARLKQAIVQTYPLTWLHDLKRFSGPMPLEPLYIVQG